MTTPGTINPETGLFHPPAYRVERLPDSAQRVLRSVLLRLPARDYFQDETDDEFCGAMIELIENGFAKLQMVDSGINLVLAPGLSTIAEIVQNEVSP